MKRILLGVFASLIVSINLTMIGELWIEIPEFLIGWISCVAFIAIVYVYDTKDESK